MRRTMPLLGLLVALLAGCSSPTTDDPADPDAQAPGTPSEETAADAPVDGTAASGTEVTQLKGSMTGVGVRTDVSSPFVGAFDTYQSVEVREDATSLTLELTWSTPAHDLYLDVIDPDGTNHVATTATPFVSGPPVLLTFEDPVAGEWMAEALANGAASTEYTITVTVAYGAATAI